METGEVKILRLPATCWHVLTHPSEELFYAISFRVAPLDRVDYHEWGIAWLKEYVFEIDAETNQVRRHWATGRETPGNAVDSSAMTCTSGWAL